MKRKESINANKPTLIMSGVIIFGPIEENAAICGAGLVLRIVRVGEIFAVGFLLAR